MPEDTPDDVHALVDDGWMHWLNLWPQPLIAGKPMWDTFHSGATWLDEADDVSIEVVTDGGTAMTLPYAD